jgi:hypothetical protein
MCRREVNTNILVRKLKGSDRLEDLRIVRLNWILKNNVWECGRHSFSSGQNPAAGFCEHGNEASGSIDARNSLT